MRNNWVNSFLAILRGCNDVFDQQSTTSGVYTVYPCGNAGCPVALYCDMATEEGVWTVCISTHIP